MKKLLFVFVFAELMVMTKAKAQSLGINNSGAAADASSILDVSSTTKGLLIPRMTLTQRNAITSPATGLMIYQIDNTPGFYYFNGSNWVQAIGPQGPTGPQGPAGATGATGPAGTNGKTVLNGSTNPTSGVGTDGDFYINTATNTLFGPKTSGSWPTGVSLVGPQGATGATGLTGATGPTGPAPSGTGFVTVSSGTLGTPGQLNGDVTSSGLTTTIANGVVTSAKIADGTITGTDIANSTIDLTSKVTGTLPVANGGTGLSTTPSNGQIDIGNGTGFTRTTLTAGSGISVTNGSGSITIANTGVINEVDGIIGNEVTNATTSGGLTRSGSGTTVDPYTLGISTGGVTSTMISDGTIATADIANNAVDGTKINLTSNAAGDMMYYNGTDWVRVPAGTSGQVLQSNGTIAPTWVTKTDKFVLPFSNGAGTSLGASTANIWYIQTDHKNWISTSQGTSPDRSGTAIPVQGAFTFMATQNCTLSRFTFWISNSSANRIYAYAVYKYPISSDATTLGTGTALIPSTNVTVSPTVGFGMTKVDVAGSSTTINAGEVIMIMFKSSSSNNNNIYVNGAMEFTIE